jgi:hypothetical protein
MENNNLWQRHAIKFCVKLRESATDTYEMIQKAFGNDSLSHAEVFRWHKDFVNGREMVKDELWSGSPTSVRTITDVAWKIRWAKCVASEGCYFEGDNVDLDE